MKLIVKQFHFSLNATGCTLNLEGVVGHTCAQELADSAHRYTDANWQASSKNVYKFFPLPFVVVIFLSLY